MGNPVCLWQTELFKLNLKSSPSSSGYNRRRRLATRSSGKQQAERTAVRTAPIVCPEESPLVRPQAHTPCPRRGMTRRLRRELGLAVPWGVHTFLSMAKEKCAKESQRHGDSRGGPPRCALFANIGVPGTAVPGSCICSGLPVANCLRQLCPLGDGELFKFYLKSSVCQRQTGLSHGQPALRLPLAALDPAPRP